MSNPKRADPARKHGIECSRCGSKEVRYVRKSNSVYCRRCGYEFAVHWIDPPRKRGKK